MKFKATIDAATETIRPMKALSESETILSIFSRSVEALGKKGDIFIGLSASGNSANVREAILKAKEIEMITIALLGRDGGVTKMAERVLLESGIPKVRIIHAPTGEIEHERTFKSAVAAWRALQKRGVHSKAVNVPTLRPHARRTP